MGGGEFLRWRAYLQHDLNAFHREDYLFAKIAQEVRRLRAADPGAVRLDDMLVKFEEQNPLPRMTPEQRMQNSKNYWQAILGFFSGTRTPPKPPGVGHGR